MIFPVLIILITILWTVVFVKKLLFWLWLWQLKQYYAKRVIDHFYTDKGKKLILNFINLAKLISVFGIIFLSQLFIFIIGFIYALEGAVFGYRIIAKNFRYPTLTKKTILILLAGFFLTASMLILLFLLTPFTSIIFLFWLLLLDLFSPLIFAFLILPFRPLNFIWQRKIIKAAKQKREGISELLVIGITGSYGKTSVKEILTGILSRKFRVLKTPEHLNTDPAIAQYMLDNLNSSYQIFTAEMGAYFKGGIKSACDFIQPKIGIITGINQQHLALFGSMENLISAEGGKELIESLPPDGLIIFNGENRHCRQLYQETEKTKRIYALRNSAEGVFADVWAEDIKIENESSSFKAICKDGDFFDFKIKLLGRHNILNVLAGVCAAKELGMSLSEIAGACGKLTSEMGSMVLKKGIDGLNIIDSSYSANPDGVMTALDYLAVWGDKKAVVMPCLIELGRASKEVHRMLGKKIAQTCDLAIITTKDRFQEIKEGAISQGMAEKNILFIENPEEIIKKIKDFCHSSDVVLLEGRVPRQLKDLLFAKEKTPSF